MSKKIDFLEYDYASDGVVIKKCDDNAVDVVIPSEIDGKPVINIGNSAFFKCSSLTNITIPDSVTNIGGYAFYGCTSLTSITIPDSVTSIGSSAFEFCTSLTSITISGDLTSIGHNSFFGCSSLEKVESNFASFPPNKNAVEFFERIAIS